MRLRQSSGLELGYDDCVALPVLVIILAIIVFIASRLLTIWIVALHSTLAIIAFVSQVNCDRSATSSGILYIFVVVMLVLSCDAAAVCTSLQMQEEDFRRELRRTHRSAIRTIPTVTQRAKSALRSAHT